MTLTNQSGEKIARFGAAGVRRALMNPVAVVCDAPKDYAMVWCEEAECYICRDGKGARSCTFMVLWWDDAHDDTPQRSKEYANNKRDAAIAYFLKLCKRELMAPNAHA